MNEKKVVAVIVEGASDEIALGGILNEYFASEEVKFAVVRGDITSDRNTTPDNVLTRIDNLVESIKRKYGYEWEDFIRIIHIADTDGTFTKDCIRKAPVEGIQYYEDHIECSDIEKVEKRNKHKSDIMFKLYSTGKVHDISDRLYFNSCNLEHVLYNKLIDFSDEEKAELSDDFAEKYEGKVHEFIEFISDPVIAVPGTYRKTWEYIEKDLNSLKRHSNMYLIFETK